MLMLNKIKADLQQMFDLHGVKVEMVLESSVEKNLLGETLRSTPEKVPQTIIIRDNTKRLKSELVGDVGSGEVNFNAPIDTLLAETKIFVHSNKRYHIKKMKPRWVFGEVVCYIGLGERAD